MPKWLPKEKVKMTEFAISPKRAKLIGKEDAELEACRLLHCQCSSSVADPRNYYLLMK